MDIGTVIRIIRRAKGMKLSALAEVARLSTPFLSLVEKGDKQPSLDVIRRIAAALDVPSEVLVLLAMPRLTSLRSVEEGSVELADSIRMLAEAEARLREMLKKKGWTDESERSDDERERRSHEGD